MSIHKLHSSFNAGELSPLMDSRVNVEKYDAGCRKLRNFILHTHGPVFRRPGLEYMGEAASHDSPSRFIAFNFSSTTTFVIEMAAGLFRFWSNEALVRKESGAVLEVAHPYDADELFEVQCKQVNDVCYLSHRNHHPHKLTRKANEEWTCELMPLRYPPLLDEFVEKESVVTPIVTGIYSMDLEEAEEFTFEKRVAATIPTFTIAPQASPANWFRLTWTWPGVTPPPGPAGKTVTLEVQTAEGAWIEVKGQAAVTFSATTAAPATQDFRFKVGTTTTSLVVERLVGAGVTTTTLAGFFATAPVTMPSLTFRLNYGPPTQNALSGYSVIVTPTAGGSGSGPALAAPYSGTLPLAPVLLTNATNEISTAWTLPATIPAGTYLTWQILSAANRWENLHFLGVSATAPTFRLRYTTIPTSPVVPTAVNLEELAVNGSWTVRGSASMAATVTCGIAVGSATATMARTTGRVVGEAVFGLGIPPGTTITNVNSETHITLSASATVTNPAASLAFFAQRDSWRLRLVYNPIAGLGLGLISTATCQVTDESTTVTMVSTTGRVVGEAVSGAGIPLGTTIVSVDNATTLTISQAATATNVAASLIFNKGGAKVVLDDTVAAPKTVYLARQKSGTGADAGKGGVTVRAGNWQARMEVTPGAASVPPDGATLYLQKWTGAAWVTLGAPWKLTPGQIYLYSGVQAGAFTADTLVRMAYVAGGASAPTGLRSAGFAVIETIDYPPSQAVTLEVSVVNGTGRKMLAKKSGGGEPPSIFTKAREEENFKGHEGSYWQIAHRREESYAELVGAVGTFPGGIEGAALRSKEIRVSGQWDLFTYGTWKGTLHLERRTSSNAWQIIRSWTSNYDRNATASGSEDQDADLRLRVTSGTAGVAASGAAVPRFVLEAADSRTYGLVKITKVVSESEAIVDVVRTLGDTTATSLWAEGAWSDVRGYPAALGLHEARLWFGGSKYQPQSLWASVSNDFENFRRSTLDDGALAVTLAAESSNSIRWLSSTTALLIGTGGEEWAMRSGTDGPLTATSLRAERQSGYSSMSLGAKMAHEVTIFVQRDARRVRQLSYTDAQQSYTAGDLTVLAPHVTQGGVRQLDFQQAPTAILWIVTHHGKLAGMTFEREQNVFGWHVHDTDGEIETVAVLHGTPADEVWCGVKRVIFPNERVQCGITEGSNVITMGSTARRSVGETVKGSGIPADTVIVSKSSTDVTLSKNATLTDEAAVLKFSSRQTRRYVERLQPQAMAADWSNPKTLAYSDCAKRYDIVPHTMLTGGESGALDAIPTASTDVPAYALTLISGEYQPWVLQSGSDAEDELAGIIRPDDYSADTNAKVWVKTPKMKLHVEHLDGKEVAILADGGVNASQIVDEEFVTLDQVAGTVLIGLPYTSELQPMKQEVQMQDGTAQGRRFKLHGVTLRMDHSLGGEVSANADDATLPWANMPNGIIMGEPSPLFTGERDLILDSRHESAVNLMVRQSDPLPLNVTALVLRFDVYDH